MKKTSIFLLLAIVASSSVCYAQKVQSYSGSKSYTTTVGYIPGTEKYSYIIDERGSKVFHGTYSFVGKDQYNDDTRFRLVGIDTINAMRKSFSSNLWDELTTIEFEKSFFPCYANWKEYLTNFYGDYLKLPPKEEQTWYHHPVILDFEHNYEEL